MAYHLDKVLSDMNSYEEDDPEVAEGIEIAKEVKSDETYSGPLRDSGNVHVNGDGRIDNLGEHNSPTI